MNLQTFSKSNLKTLSNTNLESCFKNFVLSERKITRQVLECIAEIERRKLYLENNHSSLFDYLVKDFGYSPGAAMRRIDGARLLRELPEVAEKFEKGTLTLSQATQVQRASREMKKIKNEIISSEQKHDLILKIENSSQKETEQTIAAALNLPVVPAQKEVFHRNQSVTLTITLSPEQMQLIEQAKNMISHSVPDKNWADVFTYLAKKEVARRTTVRRHDVCPAKSEKNSKRAVTPGIEKPADVAFFQTPLKTVPATAALESQNEVVKINQSRPVEDGMDSLECKETKWSVSLLPSKRPAIPARTRKKLLHPEAVCEYRYANAKQCVNTRFLQIDHIRSWSRGGTHDPQNLQVLCAIHNRLKYQQE